MTVEPNINVENNIDPADIEQNKTMAGLAYLIFPAFIGRPDSKFGKFHANQALLLVILGLAGSVILSIIPIIGWYCCPYLVCLYLY